MIVSHHHASLSQRLHGKLRCLLFRLPLLLCLYTSRIGLEGVKSPRCAGADIAAAVVVVVIVGTRCGKNHGWQWLYPLPSPYDVGGVGEDGVVVLLTPDGKKV